MIASNTPRTVAYFGDRNKARRRMALVGPGLCHVLEIRVGVIVIA